MKKFSFSGLNERTNKEQILAKVRNAVISKDENIFSDVNLQNDTWKPFSEEDGSEFTFIDRFKDNDGIFMYFENDENFTEALKQFIVENDWSSICCTSQKMKDILSANNFDIDLNDDFRSDRKKTISITDCECLIAQTGSIMLSDRCSGSRDVYSLSDILLVYANPHQIVDSFKDAISFVKNKYSSVLPSNITIVSGPSRSIEFDNQLVIGAQGIRQIALFFVEE